ncbi:MAG: hypothetical protein QOJ86_4984 [Bradyrhizobium sp.]|jgi:uncharacterized protein (DUF2384 family)|nr:hypothetical protein [Bradyrhizobium sp.]
MPNATDSQRSPASVTGNPALEAFFKIAELWSLSIEQQITLLGSPARSTFYKWKKEGGLLSTDTEERISHLVSIFKALQIVVPDAKAADTWLHRPNKYFGGRSALSVMLDGKLTDIFAVRTYLDAQRGG